MGTYCTNCGRFISDETFCSGCGKRVEYATVQQVRTASSVPGRGSYPAQRILRTGLLLCILLLVGTGIWYAGSTSGLFRDMALAKASEAWQSQSDYKEETAAVKDCLVALAAALDQGNIENALTYIDPDKAEQFRQLFNDNVSTLPNLVYALNNCDITFLSSEEDGYDALRMATVEGNLPDTYGTNTDQVGMIITLIKTKSGWVVTAI